MDNETKLKEKLENLKKLFKKKKDQAEAPAGRETIRDIKKRIKRVQRRISSLALKKKKFEERSKKEKAPPAAPAGEAPK